MRGCVHNRSWYELHGEHLTRAAKQAAVISLEGIASEPFGDSLDLYWNEPDYREVGFAALMHDAVANGFSGLFTEVDARDSSRIDLDDVSGLPLSFFQNYFAFLQRQEQPLARRLGSAERLRESMLKQSTEVGEGVLARKVEVYLNAMRYSAYPYSSENGGTEMVPTSLELGEFLFADALAAIKLHSIGKLMADGVIEKGPILDYSGALHLGPRTFFLHHPAYSMQVVLRNVHLLMAGKVDTLEEICSLLEKTDWSKVQEEIARLTFYRVEGTRLARISHQLTGPRY